MWPTWKPPRRSNAADTTTIIIGSTTPSNSHVPKDCVSLTKYSKFIPKYPVRKEIGKKIMETKVNWLMRLPCAVQMGGRCYDTPCGIATSDQSRCVPKRISQPRKRRPGDSWWS